MQTITITVPDELADQLAQMSERLPELLALSLRQPPLPARIYREILAFLAGNPTPDEIVAFRPTPEMRERLDVLLLREREGSLTSMERAEIDDFEQAEHLMVMMKAGVLPYLSQTG